MLDFLELEETVGRAWHRLIGETGTWLRFPDHAVKLEDMQAVLAICFRGFGGEHAVQIAPARARTSTHRLRLRQRMGLGEEKLAQPGRDHATLMLPPVLDLFPDRRLNRDLYLWLAAAMAMMPLQPVMVADPLRNDLARLDRAAELAEAVIRAFAGMKTRYRRLCAALLAVRQKRPLPQAEQQVEQRVLSMLADAAGIEGHTPPTGFPVKAPPRYLPMLPVPLWPDTLLRETSEARQGEDQPAASAAPQGRKRPAISPCVKRRRTGRPSEAPSSSTVSKRSLPWPRWSMSTVPVTTATMPTAVRPTSWTT